MKRRVVLITVVSAITGILVMLIMALLGSYWWSNIGPFRPTGVPRNAVFLRAPATGGLGAVPRGEWLACWESNGENRCRFNGKDGATLFEGVFIPYRRKASVPSDQLKIDTSATKYADPDGFWTDNFFLVPMIYLQNGSVLIPAQNYERGVLLLDQKRTNAR
jgi:hypothetical protein